MYTSWSVCFRWDQMCNVLVLPVTSSPPRRPRDITSSVNPSCLPTGAVESPRPSICLARKVHLGEVSIHTMTWAEDSREPMPWLPCPFGHGSYHFPKIDDDVEARAKLAARTHVVNDTHRPDAPVETGAPRTRVDDDDDDSPFSVTATTRTVRRPRMASHRPPMRDVTSHRAHDQRTVADGRRIIPYVTSGVLTVQELTHIFNTRPTYKVRNCLF